jgi:hypothetical protein
MHGLFALQPPQMKIVESRDFYSGHSFRQLARIFLQEEILLATANSFDFDRL